jgi:hypothetical protein
MRDFVAKGVIRYPVTGAVGYTEGSTVPAEVVRDWGLVVGQDVEVRDAEGRGLDRPGEDATRSEWEVYAVARGTDPQEVRNMDRAELAELYPAEDEPQPPAAAAGPDADPGPDAGPARPAESAKKAEWVEYVIERGGDESWARSSDTTKADLQEWEPGSETVTRQATTDGAADQGNAALRA